eukprot:augustus_masked-scaffold_3-processed-gene-4.45-mRNA-1 protein AED:1.00 eAED:1.00 QI:0/-1/0/0/-1/1/1/0/398
MVVGSKVSTRSRNASRRSHKLTYRNKPTDFEKKMIKLAFHSIVPQVCLEQRQQKKFFGRWVDLSWDSRELEDKTLFLEFLVGTQREKNLKKILGSVVGPEKRTILTCLRNWVGQELKKVSDIYAERKQKQKTVHRILDNTYQFILMILNTLNVLPLTVGLFKTCKLQRLFKDILRNKETIEELDTGKVLINAVEKIKNSWRSDVKKAKGLSKEGGYNEENVFFTTLKDKDLNLLCFRNDPSVLLLEKIVKETKQKDKSIKLEEVKKKEKKEVPREQPKEEENKIVVKNDTGTRKALKDKFQRLKAETIVGAKRKKPETNALEKTKIFKKRISWADDRVSGKGYAAEIIKFSDKTPVSTISLLKKDKLFQFPSEEAQQKTNAFYKKMSKADVSIANKNK